MNGTDCISRPDEVSFMQMLGLTVSAKGRNECRVVNNTPRHHIGTSSSSSSGQNSEEEKSLQNTTKDEKSDSGRGSTGQSDSSPVTPSNQSTNKRKIVSASRRLRKFPCKVCEAKMCTKNNLDRHMETHWNIYYKMEDLLKPMTNLKLHQEIESLNSTTSQRDTEDRPVEKIFSCHVCYETFVTGNKLSKHMDKHRELYNKMKEIQKQCPQFRDESVSAKSSEEK